MKHAQRILILVVAICLWDSVGWGADPLTLTITATNFSGNCISNDFSGLSFETYDVGYGDHWVNGDEFSPSDSQMLTLFENIGIHNLRIGGDTAEGTNATILTLQDITNLFLFAQAANVNVIYTLRLLDGNAEYDLTNDAEFIWTNSFAGQLKYFAIGNEPDAAGKWSSFSSYDSAWNSFYSTISAGVPGAIFAGPDTCCQDSYNASFANDEEGKVALFTTHGYFAGAGAGLTPAEEVSNMLSPTFMDDAYDTWLSALSTVQSDNYQVRFTEADDCVGGVEGASDTYASALWVLDLMHWWAAVGIDGLNFHNNEWLSTDTIFQSAHYGSLLVHPKAYGLKAWDLGGHGFEVPLSVSNPNDANDTCYAMGGGQDLYVTIVNKHTVYQGSIASCTIIPNGFQSASVSAVYLTCSSTNQESTNGVTLGGSGGVITNNAQWHGIWTPLAPDTNGSVVVDVSPNQAAVVHLHAGSAYVGPIQINQNGTLEMFANNGGVVYHRYQKTGDILGSSTNNWSNWSDLGSISGGSVTVVGGPTVTKNLSGTLEVFVSGSDGNVYANYQTVPFNAWSGWSSLGGPGATNLQVQLNPDGSLNLFGIGTNGDLWNTSQSAPGITSGIWNDLSGVQVQPGFQVGQNMDGHLEIFGVDTNGLLWHDWELSTNWLVWNGWSSLPGATINPRIQVGRNSYGAQTVFGVDATSQTIDCISQPGPDGGWNSWVTTNFTGEAVEPGFVVGQDCNGRFEIFALGTDGTFYHNWLTTSFVWSGWNALTVPSTDPQLMICNLENGALQVFGVNTSNDDVWSIWQTIPAAAWGSWSDFGGNGYIFYSGQP